MDEYTTNEGATAPLPNPQSQPEQQTAADPTAQPQAAGYPATPPVAAAYGPATYAASAPEFGATAPVLATPQHPRSTHWLVVAAAVVSALILLAIAFGFGFAVGSHANRFERGFGGPMMQAPGGGFRGRGMMVPGQQGNGQQGSVPQGNGQQGSVPQGNGQQGNVQQGQPNNNYNFPGYGGGGRRYRMVVPTPDTTTQP